jgi:hypothetical protein
MPTVESIDATQQTPLDNQRTSEVGERQCLVVYVLWRASSANGPGEPAPADEAEELAEAIYAWLFQDPKNATLRGLGIPVRFRSVPKNGEKSGQPRSIKLDGAQYSVVVPIINDAMVLDPAWRDYLCNLHRDIERAGRRHLILPVALSAQAYRLDRDIARINAVKLFHLGRDERKQALLSAVTHEVCRHMLQLSPSAKDIGSTDIAPGPVRVFLSHAKRDGAGIAEALLRGIQQQFPVQPFFDTRDIPPGWDFVNELEGQVERSAMIAVRSDAYGSRPWCRREMSIAKKSGCAIVVVDAVTSGEDRSFPYMGNVPTIRWDPKGPDRSREVIDLALREVLRVVYTGEQMRLELGHPPPPGIKYATRPPEAAFIAPNWSPPPGEDTTLLYPDPPLTEDETQVIQRIYPRLHLMTPTQRRARMTAHTSVLEDMPIGLSISESPDLRERGFSYDHTKHIFHELVRHLLAAGADVYFGGNFKRDGYTLSLMDLVREHRTEGHDIGGRIINFVAWPYYVDVSTADEADGYPDLQIQRIEPPPEVTAKQQSRTYVRRLSSVTGSPLVDVEANEVLRRCMTAMRVRLNQAVKARVLLGGVVEKRENKHAGLAEEAFLALDSGMPVYLMGGLGGATEKIIEVLNGGDPPESFEVFGEKLIKLREGRSLASMLQNGLSDAQNERLFNTEHVGEMVSLVLTGLANWAKSRPT